MGTLTYSPAQVIRQLLVDLGLAVAPSYGDDGKYNGAAWPAFYQGEPDSPDECVTVYDTEGNRDARMMIDGEWAEHEGLQIRIRARKFSTGWTKIRAIAIALDKNVYDETVTVSAETYLVHSLHRRSGPIPIGSPASSKLELFTVNYVVQLKEN